MPHGCCYMWQPGVLWLNIVSDALIALAYYSIPFTLFYFIRKRRDLPFNWMFLCFAIFIVACGTTHLMEILVIWHPTYWLSGGVKALTAAVSVPTAYLLIRLVPRALELPSPTALRKEMAERKHNADRLRESEERFRRAFDDAPIGMALVNPQGRFLKANRALCAMLGFSEAELIEKDFQSITYPDDLEKDLALLREVLAGKILSYQMEKRYFDKKREIIFVRLNVSLIREPNGDPRYFVSQVENITELKHRETEREKLIVELQETLTRVKTLSGLIPICGWCKNIRSDEGFWHTVEDYVRSHTEATFTHGVCPSCQEKFKDEIARANTKAQSSSTPEI
jgi:PAS domain S-box-containing protein